jgi:hypothetical protein
MISISTHTTAIVVMFKNIFVSGLTLISILAETENRITCIKAAALLFQAQGNKEGYKLATTWLEQNEIPIKKIC